MRKRPGDIDIFIDTFLELLNQEYHTNVTITPEARRQFRQYSWPGNVRELKNMVEHRYALHEGGPITAMSISQTTLTKPSSRNITTDQNLESIMDSIEREILLEVIRRNHGNLRRTAADLEIHRVTLLKKWRSMGLPVRISKIAQRAKMQLWFHLLLL